VDGGAAADKGPDVGSTNLREPGGPVLQDRAERTALLRSALRTVLTVVVAVVLYYLLPLTRGFHGRTGLLLSAGLILVSLLIGWQIRAIMRSPHPALRAVEAVALSLPLFLLLYAVAYFVLAAADPQAFSETLTRTDSLYFVITVFSTVGFGDITPVSETARVLTMTQMIGNLVLIGLVLRLFLAAVDRGRRRAAEERAAAARNGR
jgi:voltage-gated potassium channel